MSLDQSSASARVNALKARHVALEQQIREKERSISIDPQEVRALKRMKLTLKEEIEGIRQAS